MCLCCEAWRDWSHARPGWSLQRHGSREDVSFQSHFSELLDKFPRSPYAINRYLNETKRLYGVLDARLQGRQYLVDKYGIADIKTFGWARVAGRTGLNLDEFPNVKAWIDRIEARPAVKAGIEACN
jgi:glutathione S-transferase